MNKESFGSFIKELRQNKKYTQQELADLLYLDVSAVSKWERGVSYPDITLIPKICEVLNIDEHELIKCSRDLEYQRIKEEAFRLKTINEDEESEKIEVQEQVKYLEEKLKKLSLKTKTKALFSKLLSAKAIL